MIGIKCKVIELHEKIIEETGGIQGIRDEGILESALAAPFITFGKKDLYPTIVQKAARLGYGIASNHAFVDGNKRTGALIMIIFLKLNDIHLNYSKNELVEIFVDIASHRTHYKDLLNWINSHLV